MINKNFNNINSNLKRMVANGSKKLNDKKNKFYIVDNTK